MKLKIISIAIILILCLSNFVTSLDVDSSTEENDVVEIRIALLTDEVEDEDFYSQHGRTRYFIYALRDYKWKVGNTTYCFVPTLLSTDRLLKGELSLENFDVLSPPPDPIWENVIFTGIRLPKNILRIKRVVDFIKEGGGYFGSCAAAVVAGEMKNTPDTFFERMWKNSCFKISSVKHENDCAIPIFSNFFGGKSSDSVGLQGYIQYSGWNTTNYSINYYSGACLDIKIFKNNPIFRDFLETSRRIRWVSGQKLILPDGNCDRIKVLAKYPKEEISDNETFRIHHWEYNGGIAGLIKAFIRSIRGDEEIFFVKNLGILMKTLVFAEDWDMTDDIVETNHANSPFIISEIYPNENKARIILCNGHLEMNVWWGGHIEEMEDTDHNNIYDSFHHWVGITPEDETVEDEFSYNYWIIRRSIAWVSKKVSDNDLPPVYGSSQVSNIFPYNQTSLDIKIFGNSETSDGIESLELFYRYSDDNETWCDWILYDTDFDGSDGWSWDFNSPSGSGYYQFYSIRHVDFEGEELIEKVPPGPDAITRVLD